MNPSDVARRLQALVDLSGATPNALSELAGLDRTYLRLVLTGQRTAFGAAPMASLSTLLGADLDWLLLGIGPCIAAAPHLDPTTPEHLEEIAAHVRVAVDRARRAANAEAA